MTRSTGKGLARGRGRAESLRAGETEDDPPGSETAARQQAAATAQYIGDMVGELSELAEKANMVFLAYLLDMAREEAQAKARNPGSCHRAMM